MNFYLVAFLVCIAFIPITFWSNMRIFGHVSTAANVATLLGTFLIFSYLFTSGLRPIDSLPVFTTGQGLLIAFGIVMFSFEGISLVLPIENKMANPSSYVATFGVVNVGMSIIICLNLAFGFFGYLKFGPDSQGSITLNVPESPYWFSPVKPLFIFAIMGSYILQFYIPASIFGRLMEKLPCHRDGSTRRRYINLKVMRVTLVLFAYLNPCTIAVTFQMDNYSSETCDTIQAEELEALSAIYGDDYFMIEPENRIQTPWLRGTLYEQLIGYLDEQVSSLDDGSPVVHQLVELIRDYVRTIVLDTTKHKPLVVPVGSITHVASQPTASNVVPSVRIHLDSLPQMLPVAADSHRELSILHSDPFVDRKSVFQAHCCRIKTVGEASRFISILLADKKVAAATHNIFAWRLRMTKTSSTNHEAVTHADCDDDGETHAGSRLLHLLTISGSENIAVMVSRWYGGIQLGPDRFKHINNVARQLLAGNNLLGSIPAPDETSKPQKSKHSKKR